MAKKVKKSFVSIILIATTIVLCLVLSFTTIFIVKQKIASEAAALPQSAISTYLEEVKNKNYQQIYDNSLIVDTHFNSQEDYINQLEKIYADKDINAITYQENGNENEFDLIYNDQYLATLKIIEQDGQFIASTIFEGDNNYLIEVPTGQSISINDLSVSSDYMVSSNVQASNFNGIASDEDAPKVDIYEINNLISEPKISVDGYDKVMKDVLSNTYYVGKSADSSLEDIATNAARIVAQYPAKDGSLGAIANISITSSDFYNRVRTLENTWFTAHGISDFNAQVLNIMQQNDQTFIADVIWDYYINNGSLERTYHGGYQISFLNVNGTYKIAGFAIDNELNPANGE